MGAGLAGPPASAQSGHLLARVDAKTSSAITRLPKSFLGLSAEYDRVNLRVGAPRTQNRANPTFLELFRNLGAFGGGMPTLRIGGTTTDSVYVKNGPNHPAGTYFPITPHWLRLVGAFARESGSPLILGVNLGLNRTDLASRFARLMLRSMPAGSIRAFEIGNEPDLYVRRQLYPGRMTRDRNWSPRRYVRDLKRYLKALRAAAPRTALAGPAMVVDVPIKVAYRPWAPALPGIVKAGRGRIKLMTVHRYPLQTCGAEKKKATIKNLLSPMSLEGHYRALARYSRLAKHNGQRLRLTETNSIACGGREGVSDVFAASLWGTDWLFALASLGADGVDFHSGSTAYTPFRIFHGRPGVHGARVQPLYYAMLVFAEAMAHRARLLEEHLLRGEPEGPREGPGPRVGRLRRRRSRRARRHQQQVAEGRIRRHPRGGRPRRRDAEAPDGVEREVEEDHVGRADVRLAHASTAS